MTHDVDGDGVRIGLIADGDDDADVVYLRNCMLMRDDRGFVDVDE